MNKLDLFTFICLGLIQVPIYSVQAQTSEELVTLMAEATKNLNYEGTFIYSSGDDVDVMHLFHKYDDNGEQEKITALTGHAREIIRNNNTITCIFPDKLEVMVEKSRAQGIFNTLSEEAGSFADLYELSTIGNERIAGRDAWVVRIRPRDEYRYDYQLWIDRENYLMLKSEILDGDGKSLEFVMFTELKLHDSIADELFRPTVTGNEYTWYRYTDTDLSQVIDSDQYSWQVTWMPDGFNLSIIDGANRTESNSALEHMIYSDGIATVSIFIERVDSDTAVNLGSMNIGGFNVYSKAADGFQVTAVGEVPQPTVRRMVESVVGNR